MLERDFRAKICDSLRKCNAKVFPIIGGVTTGFSGRSGVGYSQEPGLPDVICWHTYWQGFIEFKGEKTKLTVKQKYIIEELNKRAAVSAVVCRYNSACKEINEGHYIENEKGELLGRFEDGLSLLKELRRLKLEGEI